MPSQVMGYAAGPMASPTATDYTRSKLASCFCRPRRRASCRECVPSRGRFTCQVTTQARECRGIVTRTKSFSRGMDVQQLATAFSQTTSPDPGPRKAAEEFLQRAATQPGFGLLVLQLCASSGLEEHVRLAAAVAFKNHVKFHWAPALPPADAASTPAPLAIGAPEKEQIKMTVVNTMLGQPPRVQAQLSEALALIAATDFPDHWPSLLPELVAQLRSPDAAVVNGVLATGEAIVRRFREQYKTVELVKDIKYVLGLLAMPLLELLQLTGTLLAGPQGAQADTARQRLTTVLLICRIFYSLNYQDLPGAYSPSRV